MVKSKNKISDCQMVIKSTFFLILFEGLHFTQKFLLQELWKDYNMHQRSISGKKLCELCNLLNLYNLNLHNQLTLSILRALCLFREGFQKKKQVQNFGHCPKFSVPPTPPQKFGHP